MKLYVTDPNTSIIPDATYYSVADALTRLDQLAPSYVVVMVSLAPGGIDEYGLTITFSGDVAKVRHALATWGKAIPHVEAEPVDR